MAIGLHISVADEKGYTMQYLYRAFDSEGSLLYVGISNEWHKRLHAHEKTSEWIEQAEWVKLERYQDRKSVARAEREAIENEDPKYNKQFSQNYVHPIHHWAAVKRWIKSGQADDEWHQKLVNSIRADAAIYEKKIYELRASSLAFLFLDLLSYLDSVVEIECRNCLGIKTSHMLDAHEERGELLLMEGLEDGIN